MRCCQYKVIAPRYLHFRCRYGFAGKRSMISRLFPSPLLTLASFTLLHLSAAAQVAAPPAPEPPAASAPTTQATAHAPVPDKPFELHALDPEFWKVFHKDAKLATMGTGLGLSSGRG